MKIALGCLVGILMTAFAYNGANILASIMLVAAIILVAVFFNE